MSNTITFRRKKSRAQASLNETGQMSIFVALIFQVLFVFFAMVINIGLLIHDKINLQNAVDLAAYYGAQKQAEILDEMAHINYQIRQEYKLFVWRYWVMGTMGRHANERLSNPANSPPAIRANGGGFSDKEWVNPNYGADEIPSACVSHDLWSDMLVQSQQAESRCARQYGSSIPKIPNVVTIAPFVPMVGTSANFTKEAQKQQAESCKGDGPRNFAWVMNTFYAYKLGVASRKTLFWSLRQNLTGNASDFQDLQNQSVSSGVYKTFLKNLTAANASSVVADSFKITNGMAEGQCSGQNGETAFPEIRIAPVVYFTYWDQCTGNQVILSGPMNYFDKLDAAQLQAWDPQNQFRSIAQSEPSDTDPMHSSVGFEKNPWCMAYVGVKAKTKPHKPFAPFGKEIELEARAFAQPFGGRIGPWYRSRWTRGAPTSTQGDRVDPLASVRVLGSGLESGDGMARLPNYSRYPGDKLGIKSEITQAAQRHIISKIGGNSKPDRFQLKWYGHFDSIPQTGNSLVTDANGGDPFSGTAGQLRQAEIAAVAPDLFDAVYYSVEPDFLNTYYGQQGQTESRFDSAQAVNGTKVKPLPDLGGLRGGSGGAAKYNVMSQISVGQSAGLDPNIKGQLYYVVQQWQHLLTGWAPHRAQAFTFPTDRFAKCTNESKPETRIPGTCAIGGRVGYSVRLVSRSHLLGQDWQVGGANEAPGGLLNAPSTDF